MNTPRTGLSRLLLTAIGATTAKTLDICVKEISAIAQAARSIKPDVIILIHGGPIAEPEDAQYVLEKTGNDEDGRPLVAGFYGASSMERLPVEIALREVTEKFKSVNLAGGGSGGDADRDSTN